MISTLARFFQFDRLIGVSPIGNGHINDTYRVDYESTGQIKSVLFQRINHQVFKQPELVVNNAIQVCGYLANQDYGYQIAKPLQALDGTYYQLDDNGSYWRAFSFLENTFTPEGAAENNIAYEAARAYGAFTRALQYFPIQSLGETIPGFHDTDQRWAEFLKVLAADPVQRRDETQAEIHDMFLAKPVFDQISYLKMSAALPQRVAHNDTKAGNVLFDLDSAKAVAVIDLDTVMPGTLLSDFGDMVRTFVPDCAEDAIAVPILRKEVLDALWQGYLEETDDFLTKIERENLMLGAAWMAGEQALRFLSDWLAGDQYYKITQPEHNLIRARNQLNLFKALNGQ